LEKAGFSLDLALLGEGLLTDELLFCGSVRVFTARSILSIFFARSNFFMKACASLSSFSYSPPPSYPSWGYSSFSTSLCFSRSYCIIWLKFLRAVTDTF
jgi:hypothetical protein